MNDNDLEMSERRLQEIGNQLGTPILSPTTKIQVDDQSVPSSLHSNTDIDGTIDSQPSSKNPILQYIVAGAIGLGAVGVPLTVLFGLGGTPTATKPTAPEVEESTTLADRELDNLKTQSALDIQAKGEPQTVAQTPKPAPTPAPTATVAPSQPKPQPKPVVKVPAPKPITITVQPPTVTATPATIARPVPIPVTQPVSRPIPAPVITQPRPTPIPVAAQPTPPVKQLVPEPPPLSFEQASALGMFGGDIDKPDPGSLDLAAGDSSLLSLTLPVGVNVAAHTVTPYNSLSSRNSATNGTETPLSVQLDQPLQLSQGFNLPPGTIVQFGATVNDNGAVTATSKGVFIDGTEIKVPVGAFALTASNSAALVANQRSLREGELSGADNTAAIWGAAGSLGKALVDAGNTSVVNTSGLGTSVVQTSNGNVNIPGAVLNGAFSPLAKAKESRANALAQELQQSSKLNEIPVRSPVRVFVAAAATVQIPVSSDLNATAGVPEQGRVLSRGEVEQPPTMIPTTSISATNVQPVVTPQRPTPVTTTAQPAAVPLPPVAVTQPAFTPQLPPNQVTQGINTPSPIAPTKPNNVVNPQPQIAPIYTSNPAATQPTIAVPQPVAIPTPPIQTSTVTTPQPIVTVPLPTTQTQGRIITQPPLVPQFSNGAVTQPLVPQTIQQPVTTTQPAAASPLVTTPQTSQPTTTTQSTFIPSQPATTVGRLTPTPTQLPAATVRPVVVQQQPTSTTPSPIAPTKPNNVVNTQPQSVVPIQSNSRIEAQSPPIITPTQFIEVQNNQDPATATTQPTSTELPSELIPIQFDNGGNIQPATLQNPAMAPLP